MCLGILGETEGITSCFDATCQKYCFTVYSIGPFGLEKSFRSSDSIDFIECYVFFVYTHSRIECESRSSYA